MNSIISFIKTHYIISSIGAIVIIGAGVGIYSAATAQPTIETVTVARKNLVQEVSVTGHVKPASNVDLAFERSGRVSAIYADVGSPVFAGKTLVVLDSADLYADLAQAKAQLEREQIKLADMKTGTRPEDIAVAQTAVDSAQSALTQASQSTVATLQDVFSKIDNAVHYRTDPFFSNPRSFNPQLNFSTNDLELTARIQRDRVQMGLMLTDWNTALIKLYPTDDLNAALKQANTNLAQAKSYIDSLSIAINALTAGGQLSGTSIDEYKTIMLNARADVSAAISATTNSEQALKAAVSAVSSAQSQLALKKAGFTASDIGAQEAQVRQFEGVVQSKQAAIAKNVISAPITGVVSRQDAKVGQIAPAGTVLVSLLSSAQFQIEANVPEADIAKVTLANKAHVTLDAYGSSVGFDASVVKIDPAEVIIDGVPTYKVTLQFATADGRVRSGMTANIDIMTATKDNVLTIPQRLVTIDGGLSTVKVQVGSEVMTKTIETGLRGSTGDVEVVSGLNEGDKVVVSIN